MVTLTKPSLGRPSIVEGWCCARRRPSSRRTTAWGKTRPRTPTIPLLSTLSTPRRLWATLEQHASMLRRFLPHWPNARTNVVVLQHNSSPLLAETPSTSERSDDAPAPLSPRRRRLTQLRNERGAAQMGVDTGTYSRLMELQHRDITPDDYEVCAPPRPRRAAPPARDAARARPQVLRQLDATVKPKTLSLSALDEHAPVHRVSAPLPGSVRRACHTPLAHTHAITHPAAAAGRVHVRASRGPARMLHLPRAVRARRARAHAPVQAHLPLWVHRAVAVATLGLVPEGR